MRRREFLKIAAASLASGGVVSQSDRALGMDTNITRGDFLNGAPTAATQADWDGYGGVGDYSNANGNTYAVMTAGHGIRDALYRGELKGAHSTGETFDCVVVGGGISGLAAAHLYTEKTGRSKRCLVLEDHPIFGGEARRNEFLVDGHRLIANQGSAMFFPSRWRDPSMGDNIPRGKTPRC